MDPSWIETLSELRRAGRPCALVVVTGVSGSAPREVGARLVVCDGELAWGTIGGGRLEQLAIERADALLASGEARRETLDVPLSEAAGQCCGGRVQLFVETFPWRRRRVVVFGAGHVGQALAGLAPWMRADVLVIDARAEEDIRPTLPPPGERAFELLCIDHPEEEVAGLSDGTQVVVMTHDHALDLEIVARALRHPSLGYLGLIGSDRKWARFEKRLQQRGFGPEELARVRCPIGVVRGSKEPAAIALSTALELLEVAERQASAGSASGAASGAAAADAAG